MSVVLNLFVALMLPGIIVRTRALLAGRKGAPFYQHISRLGALLCKAPVYSSATGFVFRLAPVVYLASTVAAMLLVPVGDFSAVLAFNGDIVLFCYLLALGRVMLILAAMETGSSIDGMGASREALYGALLEPALFLGDGAPKAWLVGAGEASIYLLNHLLRQGIGIPGEIELVGTSVPRIGELCTPSVSHVELDCSALMRAAFELLGGGEEREIFVPTGFRPLGSCR